MSRQNIKRTNYIFFITEISLTPLPNNNNNVNNKISEFTRKEISISFFKYLCRYRKIRSYENVIKIGGKKNCRKCYTYEL